MWKRKLSHTGVKRYGKVDRKSFGIWCDETLLSCRMSATF